MAVGIVGSAGVGLSCKDVVMISAAVITMPLWFMPMYLYVKIQEKRDEAARK